MNAKRTLAAILIGALLSSCATTEDGPSKTQSGAGIGAIAGAILGAAVSDDKQKGALYGALAGALVGAGVGRYLDEQDKQKLAASTQETITTGTAQTWTNPETGVTAQTQVKQTVDEPQQRQIPVLKDRVEQVPPLDFIGEDYAATKNANVRGGPGTDYKVVSTLAQGSVTRVVGKVSGQPWYMVSENDVASGFVSADLLAPTGKAIVIQTAAATPPPAAAQNVATTNVAGTATCRVVTQQVTLKSGETQSQDVKACRGPNGWEILNA
jgi:surface antigen